MFPTKQVKGDYGKLLELSVIFFDKKPTRGIRCITPGVTSRAH